MQLPAWVGTKIANIPQGFRGEIKLKVVNGGVTALYIEEIVDKHASCGIDFSQLSSRNDESPLTQGRGLKQQKSKSFPEGKDETDLG